MMVALTRDQILQSLEQRREELRRLGVRRLGLFGSAARNQLRDDSDLDFLVEFEQKSFDRYMDLKFWLEDSFARPVDLVLRSSLKPALEPYVLQDVVGILPGPKWIDDVST